MDEALPIVKREPNLFYSDTSRVITQLNLPGGGPDRARRICERIIHLSPAEAQKAYAEVLENFDSRHKELPEVFERHYYIALQNVPHDPPLAVSDLSEEHRLLMGAYFTKEYSIEAAAFFNPSIVPHPDQSNMPEGSCRFIMSFRAVGEGHVSSIVFRTGVADAEVNLTFNPVTPYVETPDILPNPSYDKHTFTLKLTELDFEDHICQEIMTQLGEQFSLKELEDAIWIFGVHNPELSQHQTINTIRWLAKSNYQLRFSDSQDICERVIYPYSENESKGIEDARFVRFVEDDGTATYYATYTAYNGHIILPQLVETKDFVTFSMITLNGDAVKNKGMALFPRKLDGKYHMIGRIDGENLYIMSSENIHFWHKAKLLQQPSHDWDLFNIGNCGSPIETPEGWLLLTHGVGPMRRYCLGAMLLDLEEPAKVRGYLKEPLLQPTGKEREGYVPNVVYSCGAMVHNNEVLIPYGMSDSVSGFATVPLPKLLDRLTSQG